MRPHSLLTSLALFTALTTAWPTGSWDLLGTKDAARIRARQNNNNNNNNNADASTSKFDLSFSGEQGNTASTRQNSNNNNDNTASGTQSGNNAATTSGDSRNTNNADASGSGSAASSPTFDNRDPPGGVAMITPNAIAGPQYYKIADYVTFGFNFTSLSITPSAIDILASCSLNSATYTIAANQSVTGGKQATQAVTWDTGAYQETASIPLLVGTYTLMIHDAAKPVSATPMAGYLGTWEQFTFGMYTPQPYTPLADYVCATCNGASSLERVTVGFLLGMVGVTVVSFSWFAGVAGVW